MKFANLQRKIMFPTTHCHGVGGMMGHVPDIFIYKLHKMHRSAQKNHVSSPQPHGGRIGNGGSSSK